MRRSRFAPGYLPAVLLVLLVNLAFSAKAEEAKPAGSPGEGSVSYYRDIRPVFQAHCQGCHQPAKRGGDYVMTDFAELLKGGESGAEAVIPGDPEGSYLIEQIEVVDGKAAMPQGRKPLAKVEVDKIRRWIKQGAKDDTPASARPKYNMDNPPSYNLPPVITALDVSPDGKLLAVSGYHEVLLHQADVDGAKADEADGGGLVARLVGMSERIESAVFSPDGKRLAVAGGSPGRMGEIQIWDVEKRKLQLSVPVTFDTVYGAAWSPDGKVVSFGCGDKTVRAIDTESGEEVFFNGAHNDWALDTVFSVKGTHLISVSRDRSMKLFVFKTRRFVDNITSITPGALKGGLHAIDRHPTKDELLVGGADGSAKIFQMLRTSKRKIGDNANQLKKFPEMPGRIFDVAYSPDGKQIAAGSSLNGAGALHVYDAESAKLVSEIENLPSGVYSVEFYPDGKRIVSGGFDGRVRISDAKTGKVLKQLVPVEVEGETRVRPVRKVDE